MKLNNNNKIDAVRINTTPTIIQATLLTGHLKNFILVPPVYPPSLLNPIPNYKNLAFYTTHSHALLCSLRYLEYTIAQDFTDVNGQTKLYIGRNPIFPSPAAWPIPHDAPYKPQLDRYLMAFAEVSF